MNVVKIQLPHPNHPWKLYNYIAWLYGSIAFWDLRILCTAEVTGAYVLHILSINYIIIMYSARSAIKICALYVHNIISV